MQLLIKQIHYLDKINGDYIKKIMVVRQHNVTTYWEVLVCVDDVTVIKEKKVYQVIHLNFLEVKGMGVELEVILKS